MTFFIRLAFAAAIVLSTPQVVVAQLAPEIGYVYPSGGHAGSTIDVTLGGYDWTPDIQIFVHDPRIKLEIIGPPGEVLVPPPPYWFGAKGRGPAWPLPREFPARLTIPADVPPGLIKFQVANANGASPVGYFHIGAATEVVENADRQSPQVLAKLPITVNGRIRLIEEIDRYEFFAPHSGPITIDLIARRLDSPLHGLLKVIDDQGKCVVDLADTEGRDLTTTFIARAGAKYSLSLHDLDFAGDRSYVYRLAITPGTRVQAAYPAAGRRGTTQKFEFIGHGIATGADQLETVVRDVAVPAAPEQTSFPYSLDTPHGPARPFTLLISDRDEQVEAAGIGETKLSQTPVSITGSMESRFGSDRYLVPFKKGEAWRIAAQATEIGSPLDLSLAVIAPDGKEVAVNDDVPGNVDPAMSFTAPSDGEYTLILTDLSGKSGGRNANYRLIVEPQPEDFTLTVPTILSAPIGGQAKLAVKVVRPAGHKAPIQISLVGLPAGVTAPAEMTIPEGKSDLSIDLACARDAATAASLTTLTAVTKFGEQTVTRIAPPLLLAITMKPRIKIMPEGLDDVRKVHRGGTFLAPLNIERLEGYTGEITLEMTAKQQRHRQGLASGEFVVPPDAKRVEYPIFIPEWMETTKTSRMILNGVVKVPDPKGNMRTLVQRMELRIGILPEGALLKLSGPAAELLAKPGEELRIGLTVSRAPELREPVRLELVPHASQAGLFLSEPMTVPPDQSEATIAVRIASDAKMSGEQSLQFRATALQGGKWQVVSETGVLVDITK